MYDKQNVAFTLRVKLNNLRPVVVPPRGPSLQHRLAREEAQRWNRRCALVTIVAYDGFVPSDIKDGTAHPGSNPYGWTPGWDDAGRVKLTCEVRHGGEVIFPAGQLHCALHGSSDGSKARELVMSMVAMHPGARGGEGADYYADYTPEQLAWCEEHGETIDIEREARYCDENGNVRVM